MLAERLEWAGRGGQISCLTNTIISVFLLLVSGFRLNPCCEDYGDKLLLKKRGILIDTVCFELYATLVTPHEWQWMRIVEV